MSLVALVSLSVLVVMASSQPQEPKRHYDVANARPLFDVFMIEHNRVYKDDDDKELHFKAFVKNLGKINEMNENSPSATFGINKFADYTEDESKSMHGFRRPVCVINMILHPYLNTSLYQMLLLVDLSNLRVYCPSFIFNLGFYYIHTKVYLSLHTRYTIKLNHLVLFITIHNKQMQQH